MLEGSERISLVQEVSVRIPTQKPLLDSRQSPLGAAYRDDS